ncbi:MAG TPA: hypothetical protein DD490_16240 [Acidobacteria bacterium]|nr:hypothetical protein [Acidobacteriota bacterium]
MQSGEQIGRFVLLRYLGRGGMGDVLLALDSERGTQVALKLIRRDFGDREVLEAERRGAALQQKLHRFVPEVAEVYGFEELGEFFAIIMEYVEGIELSTLVKEGALAEPTAIDIALQLCRILESLQAASAKITGARGGVIHGDIKPENIRLQEENRVRLLDFGVAKSLSVTRNFTRNLFGSTAYLSPERLAQGVVTLQSDLWAVGVVLYEMVTGRLPFSEESDEAIEARLLSRQPPPRPACSPGLQQVLLRCLAADPAQRYQTPAELRTDLEAVRAGRPPAPPPRIGIPTETRRSPTPSMATRRNQPPPGSPGTVRTRRRTAEEVDSSLVPPAPRRPRTGFALLVAVPLLAVLMASQMLVSAELGRIQQELVAAPATEVEALWLRYRRWSRWSLLGGDAAEAAMKEALERASAPILASYPGDDARSRIADWEAACRHLAALLELDSGDAASRARLAYCRGHLALATLKRLEKAGAEEADRRSRQEEAIAAFQQAAEWDVAWAPPYLSLARIYVYHQLDLPRLQESLDKAQVRGADRRLVTALQADGQLAEGRDLYRQALRVRGSTRELELLRAADRSFATAVALYTEIPGYAQTERNRAEAERRQAAVENRLSGLEGW